MGIEIEIDKLELKDEALLARLMVYYKALSQTKEGAVSLSKPLAEAIYACNPKRRSMKLEQIFNAVLDQYPDNVIVKDIDVLFNPEYQVDVLKILTETYKRKKYSVIWPGTKEEGRLIYSENGYPDYKVYEIKDYDITCII